MRPILPYGVFDGVLSQDLAIYVHLPEAILRMEADAVRDVYKGFWTIYQRPLNAQSPIFRAWHFDSSQKHLDEGQFTMNPRVNDIMTGRKG